MSMSKVTAEGLICKHGVPYPCDGPNPEVGPWTCNEDGSNPDCPNCEPDAWKGEVH